MSTTATRQKCACVIVVYAGAFWGKTKIDLDIVYLVVVDGEQFHVPGSASILNFAVVEDEGLVAFFKRFSMP
jgi:hypothetical protein